MDIVTYLITHDADPDLQNSHGSTALHLAATKGQVPVIDTLITAGGADVHVRNSKQQTCVQVAALHAHFEAVLRLVEAGAKYRDKGENDVARLLAKKCSGGLKQTYVEGRLMLAERQRRNRERAAEANVLAVPAAGGRDLEAQKA